MKFRHINSLTGFLLLALGAIATAQEAPDLLGEWTFSVKGQEPDPRCGALVHEGTLTIERKITPRAYRGKVRVEESSEKCRGSQTASSSATIRVKDYVVTVEYDEEGWPKDKLLYDGDTMEGSRGDGTVTFWDRVAEDAAEQGPTTEQLAELEAFLEQVEPELNASLSDQFLANLEKNLVKSGLAEDEAAQVAEQTISRMTACMLDELRASVLAQEVPIGQVLAQQNVSIVFNPQAMDMKTNECVQDASWNAGVRIR